MPISISCHCGRPLRVKDEAAGRKVRCPGCGTVLTVPQPARDAEDEALDILLTDAPAEERPRRTEPADQAERVQESVRQPPPAPPPGRPRPSWARDPEKPKRRKAARRERSDGPRSGIAIHPEILAGVGMMVGAALWFFIGLANNRLFIYPPILFVLGLGAVIRGFKGD